MQEIFTQLKKAQTVTMTNAERSAIRHTLVNISTHTPKTATNTQVSPYANTFSLFSVMTKVTVFVFVGFMAGSTSLAFASLKALPGDELYTIKTNVTEKITTAFTFGTEAKARVAANHLATRVSEIQSIRETGAINDANIAARTEIAFSESFNEYTNNVNKLRNEGRVARSQEIATIALASIKTVAPEQQAPVAAMMMSAKVVPMTFEAVMTSTDTITTDEPIEPETPQKKLDTVLTQALIASEVLTRIDAETPTTSETTLQEADFEQSSEIINTQSETSPIESETIEPLIPIDTQNSFIEKQSSVINRIR